MTDATPTRYNAALMAFTDHVADCPACWRAWKLPPNTEKQQDYYCRRGQALNSDWCDTVAGADADYLAREQRRTNDREFAERKVVTKAVKRGHAPGFRVEPIDVTKLKPGEKLMSLDGKSVS